LGKLPNFRVQQQLTLPNMVHFEHLTPFWEHFQSLTVFFVVDGFPNKKNMEEFVLEIIPSTIIYVNLSKKMFCIWFWGKSF